MKIFNTKMIAIKKKFKDKRDRDRKIPAPILIPHQLLQLRGKNKPGAPLTPPEWCIEQ